MNAPLTPLQQAFLALQDAEARIVELEGAQTVPIAVIGLSCRTPGGAHDAESFWRLLDEGRDAIGPIPRDRWDHDALFDADPSRPGRIAARAGGFIEDVDQFDAPFFGISPREADGMDPQQRLLLEGCWRALEHAGIAPDGLRSAPVGVFVGAASADYTYLQLKSGDPTLLDPHFASGIAHSVFSGRVSYLLGLQGPSLTIDTACSSSLTAVHLACQSLRAGECRLALAGGVNLMLAPDIYIALSRARMLAPDGRCKTFSAAADGFGRSEGCAVLALKRLDEAEADGDRILGVIRGSAINQDGPSSGLTAPNGPAQEVVIRAALAAAGLEPHDIGYIEAHGTGTELGDPLEARALASVFAGRPADRGPLWIGSVKTNIGHMEAAAGAIGLVKLILSLQRGVIPRHLHFDEPSPHIPWAETSLRVPAQATPFPAVDGARRGGVSSFGFSGANAHVIVEAPAAPAPTSIDARSRVIPLAARSPAQLQASAAALADVLSPKAALADIARTLAEGRAHTGYRAVARFSDAAALKASLQALARDESGAFKQAAPRAGDPPRIAFLFTGQGAQYAGMGRSLYDAAPVFRAAMDACAAVADPLMDRPLLPLMFSIDAGDALRQTGYAQPALFALEYSLAMLWRSVGVTPIAALGHSIGEIAAACVAEAISLADAMRLVVARGRLMQSLPAGGAMAAVFAPSSKFADTLKSEAGRVSVAAINGPAQAVISGEAESLGRVRATLAAAGVKTHPLDVSHAFHSALMDPILDAFEQEAAKARFSPPRLRVISNLTGRAITASEIARPAYWREHLRHPVRFEDGLRALGVARVDVLIEIGPQPVLGAFAASVLEGKRAPHIVASLRKDADGWDAFLDAVAALHLAGVEIDWKGLDADRVGRPIDLPGASFERIRHWFRTPARASFAPMAQAGGLPGERIETPAAAGLFETAVTRDEPNYIRQHVAHGRTIAPGAMLLEMMRRAASVSLESEGVQLSDVNFLTPLEVPEGKAVKVQTLCARLGDDSCETTVFAAEGGKWRVCARTKSLALAAASPRRDIDAIRKACGTSVDPEALYTDLAARGVTLGPSFQIIRKLGRAGCEAVADIELNTTDRAADPRGLHPLVLDACFQAAAIALGDAGGAVYVPAAIDRCEVFDIGGLASGAIAHARITRVTEAGFSANFDLMDQDGRVALHLFGVWFARIGVAFAAGNRDVALDDVLYDVAWRPFQPLDAGQLAAVAIEEEPAATERAGLLAHASNMDTVERACAMLVARALAAMGARFEAGETVRTRDLAELLGVLPTHQRLFARMLAILAEQDLLLRLEGDSWRVRAPLSLEDPAPDLESLRRQAGPGLRALIAIVERTGVLLPAALTGKADPLGALFPDGSAEDAERMYADAPTAKALNAMLARVVQAIAEAHKAETRALDILEIGGGTGGSTAPILEALPTEGVRYVFTDIGQAFLARARTRFANDPRVETTRFDVDADPEAQGIETGRFDVVIAANVVHATRDVRAALKRVRSLLKPGGVLLLIEVLRPQRWFDLTVGLTAGWWAFEDTDLRPGYCTLDAVGWREALVNEGFGGVQVVTPSALRDRPEGLVIALAQDTEAWVVLGDDAVAPRLVDTLSAGGAQVVHLAGDSVSVEALEAAFAGTDAARRRGVIDTRALGAEDIAAAACGHRAAALAQAALQLSPQPRLRFITRGAQPALVPASVAPAQAAVLGVARTLTLEAASLETATIDLDPNQSGVDRVAQALAAPAGTEIALRGGAMWTPRLQRHHPPNAAAETEAWRLAPAKLGALDGFTRAPLARRAPGPDEVEIETQAWGLNFRDVLNVLGLYPGDAGPLGGECAGLITAVGANVRHVAVGDIAMAAAGGSFASHVTTRASLVRRKPDSWTIEEAATFPIPWITASFCLEDIAGLKAGERVLIHAAGGGVGLAAVHLAQALGAEVHATAGALWKREALRALGIAHVYDSRSTEFAAAILAATNGDGVDVVLNSLAGSALEASFRVLKQGGRFVELGKRGIKAPSEAAAIDTAMAYSIVDWGETAKTDPQRIVAVFDRSLKRAEAGEVAPLPVGTFSAERAEEGFRAMAQARHFGKLALVRRKSVPSIRKHGAYLISGGLRGIGLETATHLVRRGAGLVVLFNRSGPDVAAEARLAEMRATGAEVWAESADVADPRAMGDLLARIRKRGLPLRGVIHSAGALANAALSNQDAGRFADVFHAKVEGARVLDALTVSDPLDFFVLYSSAASVVGAIGQANHAAANASLDAIAHRRRVRGLPAISLNWGAWAGAGAAVAAADKLRGTGLEFLSIEEGLRVLDVALSRDQPQLFAARIDWPLYVGRFGTAPPRMLAEVAMMRAAAPQAKPVVRSTSKPVASARDEIARAPIERRPALIAARIMREAAVTLGFESERALDPAFALNEMGLDSLLAVELRNRLNETFAARFPATLLFDRPTIDALAAYISATVFPDTVVEREVEAMQPDAGDLADIIGDLSDDEIDKLLAQRMTGRRI